MHRCRAVALAFVNDERTLFSLLVGCWVDLKDSERWKKKTTTTAGGGTGSSHQRAGSRSGEWEGSPIGSNYIYYQRSKRACGWD